MSRKIKWLQWLYSICDHKWWFCNHVIEHVLFNNLENKSLNIISKWQMPWFLIRAYRFRSNSETQHPETTKISNHIDHFVTDLQSYCWGWHSHHRRPPPHQWGDYCFWYHSLLRLNHYFQNQSDNEIIIYHAKSYALKRWQFLVHDFNFYILFIYSEDSFHLLVLRISLYSTKI